jgi:hypothetical protein
LTDIRALFAESGRDRFASAELCEKLAALEGTPWPEIFHGKPITPNRLSRMLAPYGVAARKIRFPGESKTRQGYLDEDFADAWQRYVPAPVSPLPKWNNGTMPVDIGESSLFKVEQNLPCSTSENVVSNNHGAACSIVPLQNAPEQEKQPAVLLL